MSDIFTEIGQVVLTSLLSLAAMFIFTRAGGKRQIAQMSPFDYLNAVTVGSIGAELATNLEQWWRPFSALVVYGLVTWFVHYTACKSNAMRSLWSGRSLILMDDGVILKSSLQRAAIDVNEFLGQARVAGYFDPNEIETAILETNGQISFLPKSCNRPLTPDDMQLHPDAARKSRVIWCAPDRLAAWKGWILDGKLPENGKDDCENPVDKTIALGNQLGVNGTPALMFPNGKTVPGAIPHEDIEKLLAEKMAKK